MKALVRHHYGTPEVLHIEELRTPTPGDNELLIRVQAASLNLGDWELLTARPRYIAAVATLFGPTQRLEPVTTTAEMHDAARGLRRPKHKILGADVAGRVEAVGKNVTQFRPGDDVFGMSGFGALAEYVCLPESAPLVKKPSDMTYEQAAALRQASFIALQGIVEVGQVKPGQRVLINGAGGGAGTLAVQIAKSVGTEVTGVDHGSKLEMLRSIGADLVVDYTQDDFTQTDQRYDLILDLAAHRSVLECCRLLTPRGIYLLAGGALAPTVMSLLLGEWTSMAGGPRVKFVLARDNRDDLVRMTELCRAGTVMPVIDRTYPLRDAAEAFRVIGAGRSQGKVIVTLRDGDSKRR